MKILHIITRLDKGGSAENTMETVSRLGSEAVLVSGKTYDPKGGISNFIRKHRLNRVEVPELVREISPLNDLKAFIELYKYIKKNKFDIVHTHSSKAGILGRWAAWLAGVKIIIHTPHGHVFYGYFSPLKSKLFLYMERLTALITRKIITLTEIGKNEHIKFKIGGLEKFITIPSGINMDKLEYNFSITDKKRELGIPEDTLVVGTVSRLDPIKGNKYFIEAINQIINIERANCTNVIFLIVGDGTQKRELERLVAEYGLTEKVIFTGMREDVHQIFPVIDIFILSSLMEGMGKVLLEAMLNEKPVVATNVGGIPEIVIEGESGILVNAKDYNSMADAIIKLLSDRALRESMGAVAGKIVNKKEGDVLIFSIEGMVKKVRQLYSQLYQ